MTEGIQPGIREELVTRELEREIEAAVESGLAADVESLTAAEAPDRVSRHVAAIVEAAIRDLPEVDRAAEAVRLAGE